MTLQDAQQAFRQSPNQSTALAYMDAAIAEWEKDWIVGWACGTGDSDAALQAAAAEVRKWLTIEVSSATR